MQHSKGKCLVLMPFAVEFKEVYEQVYRPACEENDFRCWRVDELNKPGSITRDIIGGILDSDLIIADLTTKNANVFYELGIAHSTGNKVIMTAQSIKDIPFDIGNYRVIVYDQTIAGAKKLYAQIDAAIKELLKSREQTNNPVQEVLSQRSSIHLPRKRLLMEFIRLNELSKSTRELIAAEEIIHVEDLQKINLTTLVQKYQLKAATISEISAIMLHLHAVSDPKELQELSLKFKCSPKVRSELLVFRHPTS